MKISVQEINSNEPVKVQKYHASQKLWKVIKERGLYYYEIKLAGEVIDRVLIEYPSLGVIKKKGLI